MTLAQLLIPLAILFSVSLVFFGMSGGYSYVENDFNGETLRDDGASYGGGFDLGMEENISMSLEYLRLVDNDFGSQELIGLGLNYRF